MSFLYDRYGLEGSYPDGHGRIDFSKTNNEMKYCLRLMGSILGLPPPDIVESNFKEGMIGEMVNLTWLGKKIEMTSYSNNGQLNGMFKVHDKENNRWMIGTLVNNDLNEPHNSYINCWIIEKTKVMKI